MNRSAVADRPEASSEGSTDSTRAPRRSTRTAIAVAVGLLIGLGVALFVPRLLDGEGPDGAVLTPERSDGATLAEEREAAADDAAAAEGPLPPGAGAPDAAAAVTGFLDAETAGDFESSFGFLGADDRRRYASPAGWVSVHADVLAPVTGYEVLEVDEAAGDTTEVITEVRFNPGLDQVTGLTPAAARVTWVTSAGPDGSWGVDLEASTIEAVPVPDDDVATTVRAWADGPAGVPALGERASGPRGFAGAGRSSVRRSRGDPSVPSSASTRSTPNQSSAPTVLPPPPLPASSASAAPSTSVSCSSPSGRRGP